ncbi:MAG: T9SS type A sorting domain-containing protein [Dysgonamonadaceae bacterium]|nr:T9SS type A sorting domain-containing protein [Dysgonamonadaceae bacterium]
MLASGSASGVYFVNITFNNSVQTIKIIKK